MTALHRLWRAIWPGQDDDAADDHLHEEIREKAAMIGTKTTANLTEAHRLHDRVQANPVERVYLEARPRRTHAPDHG